MMKFRPLILAACLAGPATAGTALFPVKMLDTSHEARDQSAEHARRTALIATRLGDALHAAAITPDQVAAACAPETPDCLHALARDSGADRALFVTVVKTSTLIMQLYVVMTDSQTGTVIASRDLNFRGDTDESWTRAADFLAERLPD